MSNPFFRSIMSFAPRPKYVKPFRAKAPKPKGKGGSKAPGYDLGPDMKSKEFYSIFLEAGVSDSQQQAAQYFKKNLKNLSAKQLNKLMKKINSIAESELSEKDILYFNHLQQFAENELEPILRRCYECMENLFEEIRQRIETLDPIRIEEKKIRYHESRLRPRDFAKEYFSDIIQKYDRKVQEGIILPERAEKRGVTFVRNYLLQILEEDQEA